MNLRRSPRLQPTIQPTTAAAATLNDDGQTDEIFSATYNVALSTDPFMYAENIDIKIRGRHPTQGLLLQNSDTWNDRVIITGCQVSTMSRRVHK